MSPISNLKIRIQKQTLPLTQPAKNSDGVAGSPPAQMPLTSIEHFHLLSGSSAHPNVLFCRVIISGTLHQKLLNEAMGQVLNRHFLINRRLAKSSQRPTWINDPNCQTIPLTSLQVLDDRPLDASFIPIAQDLETKLNLNSTCGTHVWYLPLVSTATQPNSQEVAQTHAAAKSMLFFAIHHSVTDGLGGSRVINEILIAYDNLVAGRAWDDGFRRLAPARLSQRNRLGLNRWDYWKHLWKQPIALAGMAKFLFRGFHVIKGGQAKACGTPNIESDSQTLGLRGRWISEDLSAQIDRSAAEKSISANSIAMASVFYALPTWSRQLSDTPVEKWFRMVLPISIASKNDLRSPITNRATIVQIDRCEDQMRDVDSFLHYLDREVKIIVGWQFDKLFLLLIRMMSVSRGWLRRSAANPRARGTIVFTNLGQPFRSVDKRLQKLSGAAANADHLTDVVDFDYAGPIRSGMPLNFTIQRHQQRYRITARFDGRVLTTDQADRFLDQVETEMNKITSRPPA